jgi:hypothetical protein
MLEAFLASFETEGFDHNGVVRLERVVSGGHGLELSIRTEILGEAGSACIWKIDCDAVCDFRFLPSVPDPVELVSDGVHPALRQHVDTQGDLVFTGSTDNLDSLLGALWRAHSTAAGRWIPFERYLNPLVRLEKLLSGRYGKLAAGPCFLLDAYAKVLTNSGYSVSPLLPRPAVVRDGARRYRTGLLKMLRLGDSFVIAEGFSVSR